ncbi:MAG TPA: polysaccharide deacetylase family protein [Acidimicrobiales bacterium]|nr:polysaccharide deacetylase family protein [Acidimicrobiales bacterium]
MASQTVKVAAATSDSFRLHVPGVTILGYHRVGQRSNLSVDLPVELFTSQMAELAESGRVASLDRALQVLGQPGGQENYVVVTFDDGTADFVDVALPVLERFQIPATLYVATDFIERGIPFPHEGKPVSWAALSDALSTGLVTVGSHTHTHALLDRLDPAEVARELDRSTELISQRLGRPAHHFAYPKAVPGSPCAVEAIGERFRSAALAGTRRNRFGQTDPQRLARSPIQISDGMRWFRRKVSGGMRLEDDLRRIANRRRYAGATT